jgi:tetratricopeptide (TPR) repeat protein
MISERHYDDDTLLALVEEAEAGGSTPVDSHLNVCTACAQTFRALLAIPQTLTDAEVWDGPALYDDPSARTAVALRVLAQQMDEEDAAAKAHLAELSSMPVQQWRAAIDRNAHWQTAGMVRKLIEAADTALNRNPPDALLQTGVAVDIARSLRGPMAVRLLASALREQSYVLYYTGDFISAEKTLISSIVLLDQHLDAYELARANVMRSLIERARDEFDAALGHVSVSARTFAAYGDLERYVNALSAEAAIRFSQHHIQSALTLWTSLEAEFGAHVSEASRSALRSNIAVALRESGHVAAAEVAFADAERGLQRTGGPSEIARSKWQRASLIRARGDVEGALAALAEAEGELSRLDMRSEVAFVALDTAELLISLSRFSEAAAKCRFAMSCFEAAGQAYTSRAMTALAYLAEAAEEERANEKSVAQVRTYLKRLPKQPNLLFFPLQF